MPLTEPLPEGNLEVETLRLLARASVAEQQQAAQDVSAPPGADSAAFLIKKGLLIEQYNRDTHRTTGELIQRFGKEILPKARTQSSIGGGKDQNKYLEGVTITLPVDADTLPTLRSTLVWTRTHSRSAGAVMNVSLPLGQKEPLLGSWHMTTAPFAVAGEAPQPDGTTELLLLSLPATGELVSYTPSLVTTRMRQPNWEAVQDRQREQSLAGVSPGDIPTPPQADISRGKLVLNHLTSNITKLTPARHQPIGKPRPILHHDGLGSKRKKHQTEPSATFPVAVEDTWGSPDDLLKYGVMERLSTVATKLGKGEHWLDIVDEVAKKAPPNLLTQISQIKT
jgi:hypothetical protein